MKKDKEREQEIEDVQENQMVQDMDDLEELGKEMEQPSQNENYPIDHDESIKDEKER